MKIQYCSDLHLEFNMNKLYLQENPLLVEGDILILAGDITLFNQIDHHKKFFKFLSDNFQHTYWIPGNHEYYHFDISTKCGVLNEKINKNVSLVNNIAIQHNDVNLIFSTLWSKIDKEREQIIEKSMSDFHVIRNKNKRFNADTYNQLHLESLRFLEQELSPSEYKKNVVVSHHVPTFQHYPEIYRGSIINQGFAVDLDALIEKSNIDYWIYGHHHSNTAPFNIGKTQMLTNQLGYVQQNEHLLFNPSTCFEI